MTDESGLKEQVTMALPADSARPGIYQMYADRTAEANATFLLPHLRPGMSLLDVGCGLGSITVGLAEAVAPGRVVGLDLDQDAIVKARALAAERGTSNVEFRTGSIYELPFPDPTFDAIFAHMVLMHLDDPAKATAEVQRVLKPGGVFGCAERAEQGDMRASTNETIEDAWGLFMRWHEARGSNLRFGLSLPRVLREAGFEAASCYASYGKADTDHVVEQFKAFYNEPRIVGVMIERGWTDSAGIDRIRAAIEAWSADSGHLWALARCEAVAWKPGGMT